MLPSAHSDSVGTPKRLISRLHSPGLQYPCPTLRRRPRGRRRMVGGHRGALLPRCRTLPFLSRCRFIPALPNVSTERRPQQDLSRAISASIHRAPMASRRRGCRRGTDAVDAGGFGVATGGKAFTWSVAQHSVCELSDTKLSGPRDEGRAGDGHAGSQWSQWTSSSGAPASSASTQSTSLMRLTSIS